MQTRGFWASLLTPPLRFPCAVCELADPEFLFYQESSDSFEVGSGGEAEGVSLFSEHMVPKLAWEDQRVLCAESLETRVSAFLSS